jgi:hypothetical protein
VLSRELIRDGKYHPQGFERQPRVNVDNLHVVNEMDKDLTCFPRLYRLALRTVSIAAAATDPPFNGYRAENDAADRRLQYPSLQ